MARKKTIHLHPAYDVVIDRFIFALTPLVEEIQALELENQKLLTELHAAGLRNKPPEELDEYGQTPVTFDTCKNLIKLAVKRIPKSVISVVLRKKTLKQTDPEDYTRIANTLRSLMESSGSVVDIDTKK